MEKDVASPRRHQIINNGKTLLLILNAPGIKVKTANACRVCMVGCGPLLHEHDACASENDPAKTRGMEVTCDWSVLP